MDKVGECVGLDVNEDAIVALADAGRDHLRLYGTMEKKVANTLEVAT